MTFGRVRDDKMNELNTKNYFSKLLFLTTVLFFCVNFSFAQPELPKRNITVTATQPINFGTFCLNGGSGGTVTVGYDGSRTSIGGIILLSMSPTAQPAIFEVKLCHGRDVIITFDPTTTLIGSLGVVLTLDIGPTEKGGYGASFPTNNDCDFITPMRVGGTLHIPGIAVPDTYTGSFYIIFNQQ